jgi:membrane protein implicated in regulation of membrane protease activity
VLNLRDSLATATPEDRILFLTFGLSLLNHTASIWRLGGVEAFLVSHWYSRQEDLAARFGDLFVVYSRLAEANQILFVAAAALLTNLQIQRGKLNARISTFIAFALLLQMVMSGNRIFIALYGLSFLVSCWLHGRGKWLAALLVASPAMLVLFSSWSYFRHDLSTISEDIPKYTEADLGNRVMTTLMDTTEGVSVVQLLHIAKDFGSKFEYFYGLSYTKAVTFVLPRRLYPNKPQNFPVLIAKLYEPGEVTSFTTTQLGELYANFGPLSVLLLPAITVLILLGSERLTRKIENHALLSAVLFVLLIWYSRSSFEDNFIIFLFTLLLIWGLNLERGLFLPAHPRAPSLFTPSS